MIDKICSIEAALADVSDGCTILVSGFGEAGSPTELIHALVDSGARELTIVANNAGNGRLGLARLLEARRVRKIICSYPRGSHSFVFNELFATRALELEVIPQGTLAERIRAGGAGIGGFYTPTGADTVLANGRETREIDGRLYLFEQAIKGDVALVKAWRADSIGNLTFAKTARNFGPIMCAAAKLAVVQVRDIVQPGMLDPESIVTPSLYVQRIVHVAEPVSERAALENLETS